MTLRGSADHRLDVPAVDTAHEAKLEALRPGLRLMALRHLEGDTEAADDAVQETIVRALVALRAGRLDDVQRLSAFVRGIARHVLADMIRARQFVALDDQLRADRPDPLSSLISEDEQARVRHALGKLSESDQEIVRLSFFEGLSPAEIALRLGEPATRVRKRKSRALDRLRTAFRLALSREPFSTDIGKGGSEFH